MKFIPDWQPIETAPQNGEAIVLWCKEGYWVEAFWQSQWGWCCDDGYGSWQEVSGNPTYWIKQIELEGPNHEP